MRSQKSNIGLDIGSFSIKLTEIEPLDKNKKKLKLMNFYLEDIKDRKIEEVLGNIVDKLKLKKRFVNVAVGGEAVIVRLINIPKMTKEELNSSLRFEAEKFIPFDIKEVEVRAQILRDDLKDNKMQVLLAAVKRKNIEDLVKLIINAGLVPGVIDVEAFVLYNAYEISHPGIKETCLLLNIGDKFSNINILEEGILAFSRDIFIGGRVFTGELIKKFELEDKKATELKKIPGEKKEEMLEILKPLFLNLKSELNSSIDYFETQFQKKVAKLYFSGGGAYLEGLREFFEQSLEIETEILDCFAAMEKDSLVNAADLNKNKGHLAMAMGLALRG
ncbi:MAG: type IV pilus assembly protein PilM [Candidatus Omnitrophota bacterium]